MAARTIKKTKKEHTPNTHSRTKRDTPPPVHTLDPGKRSEPVISADNTLGNAKIVVYCYQKTFQHVQYPVWSILKTKIKISVRLQFHVL